MSVSAGHSAAGQLAGYLFQPERALYYLAKSPSGSRVGIETLDDVAVCHPDGTRLLEQDKHSIGPKSPLVESKTDMWKAFSIWLEQIASAEVDVDSTHFYLVTNKAVTSGFCTNFVKGEHFTKGKATQLVQSLRDIGKKSPATIRPFSEKVLAHSDKDIAALFLHLTVLDESHASAGGELKKHLKTLLPMPQGKENEIIQGLLGWVHDTTLALIREGKQAWLTREAFTERFLTLVNRFHDRHFLNETAEALIVVTDEKRKETEQRLFVKQVLWLGFPEDDEQLLDAIDDFIRSSSERIRLAEIGTATLVDFEAFEKRLTTRWKNIFRNSGSAQSDSEQMDKGKQTFFKTLDHREPLAGLHTLEYYLTRGAYHKLADSPADRPEIGWHPHFKAKCQQSPK